MKHHSAIALTRARTLRRNAPDAERRLWQLLRNRNLVQFKFRRQHPIAGYIVDFVCVERRLIVELDGSQHLEQVAYDEARTRVLVAAGFRVVRFWDNEVLRETEGVLERIHSGLRGPSP